MAKGDAEGVPLGFVGPYDDSEYSSQHGQATPRGATRTTIDAQPQTRFQKLTRSCNKACSEFFLGQGDEWNNRSALLHSNPVFGGAAKTAARESGDTVDAPIIIDDSMHGSRSVLKATSFGTRSTTAGSSQLPLDGRRPRHWTQSHKDSVYKIAYDGVKTWMVGSKYSKRKPTARSHSFTPASLSAYREERSFQVAVGLQPEVSVADETFFDSPRPTGATPRDEVDAPPAAAPTKVDWRSTKTGWRVSDHASVFDAAAARAPDEPDGFRLSRADVKEKFIDELVENSNRHDIGIGAIGKLCGREYRQDRMDANIRQQINSMVIYRPYFTYWVTFVQIVVFIASVSVYGIAPFGVEESRIHGEVRTINIAVETVQYVELDNLWVGPRQADLIHLGAKYSPCMRRDVNVENAIRDDHEREKSTACCVRNDGAGCVQTDRARCSRILSQWHNWSRENPGFRGRYSGSVCGQDPQFCNNPSSQGVFTWPDDISRWPICRETRNASTAYEHMTCDLIGRPCCTGIQGECRITTREDCEFRHGYFHEEAFLCSQVSCMDKICGMLPFLNPEVPDQFYRLWISMFLHAGLFQLIVTIVFQLWVMRDVEKMTGWVRLAIIYIGCGITGSLASAIFLPYHAEAGPTGSQLGVIAILLVELIQNWRILDSPGRPLGIYIGFLVVLFALGLLPYIDNYAHLIGFVFGFLLSFAILPFIDFGKLDKRNKIIGIVVCLVASVGLFALLIVLFYVTPVYNCPYCHYFNCIPFTPKFCKSMEVRIGSREEF